MDSNPPALVFPAACAHAMPVMRLVLATLALCIVVVAETQSSTVPRNGLSVTLRADPATVPMGAAVDFDVSVAFDTTKADPKTRILNRYSETCEFTFVNDRGESFRRQPFSMGMLIMPKPEDLVRLTNGAHLVLDPLRVHLLSDDGAQIPPGEYSVTVTYANDGDNREAYIDSAGQYRSRGYRGPWHIWAGRVESAPFKLTILSATPARVDVEIPGALATDTTTVKSIPTPDGWIAPRNAQLVWWCNPDSTKVIQVTKRPGFALGNRWHLESRVAGKTISEYPRAWGGLLGASGKSYLHPDVSSQLLAARDSELVLHMEVFETSEQPKHGWAPERGDFKVLWTGQVRHRLRGKN